MKKLFVLLFLSTGTLFAQSPFDGTWIIHSDPSHLPHKPAEYILANGIFHCSGCIADMEVKPDGRDYKILNIFVRDKRHTNRQKAAGVEADVYIGEAIRAFHHEAGADKKK